VKAISDLKALGVAVPVTLYLAASALAAEHGTCTVLPFKPKARHEKQEQGTGQAPRCGHLPGLARWGRAWGFFG